MKLSGLKCRFYGMLGSMFLTLEFWCEKVVIHLRYFKRICVIRMVSSSSLTPAVKYEMLTKSLNKVLNLD